MVVGAGVPGGVVVAWRLRYAGSLAATSRERERAEKMTDFMIAERRRRGRGKGGRQGGDDGGWSKR